VQPTDAYLREDLAEGYDAGGAVYFPDGAGNFHLPEVIYCTLIVEGTTAIGFARRNDSSPVASPGTVAVASMPPPPLFKSVVAAKKQPSITIKIIQARLSYKKNKPEFFVVNHHFISITESTANVQSICEALRKMCGEDYTVVTKEGFEIIDSLATRGIVKDNLAATLKYMNRFCILEMF